ncbi:hypothetical protein C8R43DRAFT_889033 [Mycena crocata]|nr:hypothetical protein C8R43DRAFT_889033 [Mycena crocata]
MKLALSKVFVLLSAAAVACTAFPTETRHVDGFVLPILYPRAETVWTVGTRQDVVWDISNVPKQIANSIGRIMLRKGDLSTPVILQENFSILLGRIEVRGPLVLDGPNYQIVLFGDSANFSPEFRIIGA